MITFEGMDELEKALGRLDLKIGAIALPMAVERAAQLVRRDAVKRCPTNHGKLRGSILTDIQSDYVRTQATVYTNAEHAAYVEFGTGKKGAQSHAGISPDATPVYTSKPAWWIHEGDDAKSISKKDADMYHMPRIEDENGEAFRRTEGQPAHPFMYPALKDNEQKCTNMIINVLRKEIKKGL